MFTNKNLEVGMLVITKNGKLCLVQPSNEGLILVDADNGCTFLRTYFNDLTIIFEEYNIEKIYGLPSSVGKVINFDKSCRKLLWQREEPKFYVVLPARTFREGGRYLNYSSNSQSYFFGTKDESKSLPSLKTKFTLEEANEVKNIIKSSIGIVEIKGEKEWVTLLN